MQPPKFFIAIIALLLIAFIFAILLRGDEDTWVCQDGQWIKHGNPSAEKPTEPCN